MVVLEVFVTCLTIEVLDLSTIFDNINHVIRRNVRVSYNSFHPIIIIELLIYN